MAKKAGAERGTYHHGDLRLALVHGARELLAEEGIEAFSLRAVARLAGVSPAAPAYHFGDMAGLLTELAICGFKEMAQQLATHVAARGHSPSEKLLSLGQAYLRFAFAQPELFYLMFRKEKLRITDELKAAATAAFAQLESAVFEAAGTSSEDVDPNLLAFMLASWSMVHGFTHLALDGQFERFTNNEAGGLNTFCDTYLSLAISQLKMPLSEVPAS